MTNATMLTTGERRGHCPAAALRPCARRPSAGLWLALAAAMAGLLPAAARGEDRSDQLRRLLERLPDQRVRVSACIIRLPGGEVVYERDADLPLVPASNQKLVAAAAALQALGTDYAFETRLHLRGPDLVLIGGGDPALGDAKIAEQHGFKPLHVFETWADSLRARGLTQLAGDVLVDDHLFDAEWVHASWEAEDLTRWYAAPVGALNFNDNCIDFNLRPTTAGRPVAYDTFPPTPWLTVRNNCAGGSRNAAWVRREDPLTYSLRGETAGAVTIAMPVHDPGLFAGRTLQATLQARGVALGGSVRRVEADPAASADPGELIGAHRTAMADVLARTLSDSQNLFAECLMKHVAAAQGGSAGSWATAAPAIEAYLRSWGISTTGLVIADGSGLSRLNRISARQMAGVLKHVFQDRAQRELFISALARPGSEGTLRRRMKDIAEQVWAKTGYLTGVRTLSGYVRSGTDEWFAFSVLFNDITGGTAPYNKIHDDVCRALSASE